MTNGRVNALADALAARLAELQARAAAAEPGKAPHLLYDALAELAVALEELHVATAELAQQNEELIEARDVLERERSRYSELFEWAPDGYVVTSPGGVVKEANRAAQRLLGTDAAALEEKPLVALVLPEDHGAYFRLLADARATPGQVQTQLRLCPPGREPFPVLARSAPVRSPEGEVSALRWLVSDITERQRSEDELRRALVRLRGQDDVKSAFILGVAHDLRAPVLAINALVQSLVEADDAGLPEPTRSALRRIGGHADTLYRMQTDLLDLERLARGIVRPHRRATNLAALVHDVVKRVDVGRRTLEVTTDDVEADVDPGMIESMVEKLLRNAASHTPERTSVWVRVESDAASGMVTLIVEDDGPGVPENLREQVFDLFHRGQQGEFAPGIGAGLYLVRRFAELHGGEAWVTERPGGGASFGVRLPLGSDAPESDRPH